MEKILVLYVDDEAEVLETIRSGLEERDYEVITATSGSEGLKLLRDKTPDVIITDIRMTPMNGFEFFQQVRKIPKFSETPFFFLTVIDDYLAQKYSHTLGVDAYINKPVDISNLDQLIRQKVKK